MTGAKAKKGRINVHLITAMSLPSEKSINQTKSFALAPTISSNGSKLQWKCKKIARKQVAITHRVQAKHEFHANL